MIDSTELPPSQARGWIRWLLLGTALLLLPSLALDHVGDDWMILARVRDGSPWDGYTFVAGPGELETWRDHGVAPWWTDPGIRAAFLRPLSSGLLALEQRAFGAAPAGSHLLTLLAYLAVVGLAALLLARLLPPRVAWVAAVVFALDSNHAVNAVWTANRHASLSVAFGLAAILLHLEGRGHGHRPGRVPPSPWALPVSRLLLVLALAAGETGIEAFGFLFAFELLAGSPGRDRTRATAWLGLLAGHYLACHRATGHGVVAVDLYVNPLAEPGRYLCELGLRLPALLGGLLVHVPVDLWVFADGLKPWLAAAGLGAGMAFVPALVPRLGALDPPARRELAWLWLGSLLALFPAAAAPPSSRQLLLPSLGSAVAIALVVAPIRAGALPGGFGRAMAWLHLGLSPLLLVGQVLGVAALDRSLVAALPRAPLAALAAGTARVVVVNGPVLGVGVVAQRMLFEGGAPARGWFNLAWSRSAFRLDRIDEATFDLTLLDDEPVACDLQRLVRSDRRPLRVGDVVALAGLEATVLGLGRVGPARVRFRFDRPLEDPGLRFLAGRTGVPGPLRLPPPGGSLFLPRPELL